LCQYIQIFGRARGDVEKMVVLSRRVPVTMLAGSSLEPSLPRLELLASLRLEQAELKQGGLDLSEGDGDGGRGGVEPLHCCSSAWLETELGGCIPPPRTDPGCSG